MASATHAESTTDQAGDISGKIAKFLEGAFASVALTRREHFEKNSHARPTRAQVKSIIKSYANQNAVIAGGASLVPGPWGALAAVPEIILILRNQIQMVYDLGVAFGKETHLTSETLLALFAAATGGGAISLVSVHGGKLLIRRASLKVMQSVVKMLGGKIAQKVLKSLVAKWIPAIGALAMGIWARQSTIAMGEKLCELLDNEFEYDGVAA